jgi:hypothetical protein
MMILNLIVYYVASVSFSVVVIPVLLQKSSYRPTYLAPRCPPTHPLGTKQDVGRHKVVGLSAMSNVIMYEMKLDRNQLISTAHRIAIESYDLFGF